MALAIVAAANILFLFLIDVMSSHPNAYVGILGYMVMPAFLVAWPADDPGRHVLRASPSGPAFAADPGPEQRHSSAVR